MRARFDQPGNIRAAIFPTLPARQPLVKIREHRGSEAAALSVQAYN
jgi:hypothetical protein